jgi:hypothetical protein
MTIKELAAEVTRCQEALEAAQEALYAAQVAGSKYHEGDTVRAFRKLPGRHGRAPRHAEVVHVHIHEAGEYSYTVRWRLKDGTLASVCESIWEHDIEKLLTTKEQALLHQG